MTKPDPKLIAEGHFLNIKIQQKLKFFQLGKKQLSLTNNLGASIRGIIRKKIKKLPSSPIPIENREGAKVRGGSGYNLIPNPSGLIGRRILVN